MADTQPTFGGAAAAGAVAQPQYMGRTMKCYPVHEFEMESLSTLNTLATAFFSVGSALAGYAASIWVGASFSATQSENGKIMLAVAPLAAAGAIICVVLGVYMVFKRGSIWTKIRNESTPITVVAAAPVGPA